jgi:hypothetical protein
MKKTGILLAIAMLFIACDDQDKGNTATANTVTDMMKQATTDMQMVVANDMLPAADLSVDMTVNSVEINQYRCTYKNPFSQAKECKSYTGAAWTADKIAMDCMNSSYNMVGELRTDGQCGFESQLGSCEISSDMGEGYLLEFEGDRASLCTMTQNACVSFLSGTFTASPLCAGNTTDPVEPMMGGNVFMPPELVCKAPLEGEAPGQSANGEVCTYSMISACTEPGRAFEDYASCETVLTQRPYYPSRALGSTPDNDPRLNDTAYMAELGWVTEQINACACVCCHSNQVAPQGASIWATDGAGIWTDAFSDEGIAMMAGLINSDVFGAYLPEDNHGFDRSSTGAPTTDVARMQKFFSDEFVRRGRRLEEASSIPEFGGPLVAQRDYQPTDCNANQGVINNQISWIGGDARYVYLLEGTAKNPGVPPNLDLPVGTIWRLDVLPQSAPMTTGIPFGEIPAQAIQQYPREGRPTALEAGRQYYLYVMRDVGIPITRCLFTYQP